MSTCGKCGKSVGASDVTCPHCAALLAAYTSPIGSGEVETYQAPPPPPSTEIPSVDLDVKPPSEANIVTDPAQVAEEAISTAPRPLFDTYVTVEEIVKAAEGDHTEDVVTVSPEKVATKAVEFEIPDYAKPPVNAAPIPTIEEDDASVPLITRDSAPPADVVPAESEVSAPEPAPEPPAESWLSEERPKATKQRPERAARPKPEQRGISTAKVGQTDDYLRKLHKEAGYTASEAVLSEPVAERRISREERAWNRKLRQDEETSVNNTLIGSLIVYGLIVLILWLFVFGNVLTGNFPGGLLFIAIAMTWGFKPFLKFLNDMMS